MASIIYVYVYISYLGDGVVSWWYIKPSALKG
jgi:hypothetical protein